MNEKMTRPLKRRRKKKANVFKRLTVYVSLSVITVLFAGFSYAGYVLYQANQVVENEIAHPSIQEVSPEDSAKVKPIAIALLGLDSRKETGSLNTDVVMVIVLNPESKKAKVLSIPRDTYVELTGYHTGKLNSYYANFKSKERRGKIENADQEVKTVIGQLVGVPIDYLAVLNFRGFSDVVDALGGIEVDVDMRMLYRDNYDHTYIDLKEGMQVLNGKKALDFVRFRKSNMGGRDSSDFERNKRQTQVLNQILKKVKSFAGLTHVHEVLNAVGKNLKTDIPEEQIKDILKTYYNIELDQISYTPLEGTWKSPYVYLDDEKLQQTKKEIQELIHKTD